jgi:hypothetical protein
MFAKIWCDPPFFETTSNDVLPSSSLAGNDEARYRVPRLHFPETSRPPAFYGKCCFYSLRFTVQIARVGSRNLPCQRTLPCFPRMYLRRPRPMIDALRRVYMIHKRSLLMVRSSSFGLIGGRLFAIPSGPVNLRVLDWVSDDSSSNFA